MATQRLAPQRRTLVATQRLAPSALGHEGLGTSHRDEPQPAYRREASAPKERIVKKDNLGTSERHNKLLLVASLIFQLLQLLVAYADFRAKS